MFEDRIQVSPDIARIVYSSRRVVVRPQTILPAGQCRFCPGLTLDILARRRIQDVRKSYPRVSGWVPRTGTKRAFAADQEAEALPARGAGAPRVIDCTDTSQEGRSAAPIIGFEISH